MKFRTVSFYRMRLAEDAFTRNGRVRNHSTSRAAGAYRVIINADTADGRDQIMVSQIAPDVLEGTWEEIAAVAPNYNGHRLRLIILPNSESESMLPGVTGTPSSPYSEYLKSERAKFAGDPPATPEEIAEAEAEVQELLNNLNENRRREGADLFF